MEGMNLENSKGLLKSIRGDIGNSQAADVPTDEELELINGYTRKDFLRKRYMYLRLSFATTMWTGIFRDSLWKR